MNKERLTAFSDGVIAIIITIMVLELKVPRGADLAALVPMIPKFMGRTTIGTRPDLVEGARVMMRQMSPEDISLVQQGMAARPDSVADLKTIDVPTMIVIGEEDTFSTVADGELMRQNIAGSQLKVIPKAGHYAPWEQPEAVGAILRRFLDDVSRR